MIARAAFGTLLILATAAPAPTSAQQRSRPDTLQLIDAMVERGDIASARTTLDAWTRAHPATPATDAALRAHQLYLSGALARDWPAAENALLSVALTHPTSQFAPLALLRLGQGLIAAARAGDGAAAQRAAGYLQRLATDYPNAPVRPQAFLWLAYAHEASGKSAEACAAASNVAANAPTETATLALDVQRRLCAGAPASPTATTDVIAVQIGAFRTRESADQLATRALRAGFEARVVTIQGGSIFRVRIGRFSTQADAQSLADRLRRAGYDTAIVNDVTFESSAR